MAEAIKMRREQLWDMQGPHLVPMFRERLLAEVAQLEAGSGAQPEQELLPRQSGSLEWRSERGEMGKTGDGVMAMMPGYKDIEQVTPK